MGLASDNVSHLELIVAYLAEQRIKDSMTL
jgi:hypothetical protein